MKTSAALGVLFLYKRLKEVEGINKKPKGIRREWDCNKKGISTGST